jgi:hypothetical protein
VQASLGDWHGQASWHDFGASASSQHYGRELDVSVSRRFAGHYELLAKCADYSADGLYADTLKFWLQLNATF